MSIITPAMKKITFPLREKDITIGRSRSANVTVNDDLASSIHLKIYLQDTDNIMVEDLGSKNGIKVNEKPATTKRMYIGDTVTFGSCKLRIDATKTDAEVLNSLKKPANMINTSTDLKLELRTEKANKFQRKNKISESDKKLYRGIEDEREELDEHSSVSNIKQVLLRALANLIDLISSAILIPLTLIIVNEIVPSILPKTDITPRVLFSGNTTFASITGFLLAILFYRWSRNRKNGSIGKKLLGIK